MKYKRQSLVELTHLTNNFHNKVHLKILNLKKSIFVGESKILRNKLIPKNFKKQILK